MGVRMVKVGVAVRLVGTTIISVVSRMHISASTASLLLAV